MLKAEAIAPALGIMWLQMQSDRDDIEQLTQQNNVLKRQLDEYREELGRLTEETSRLQGADSAHMDEGGPGRDASGDAADAGPGDGGGAEDGAGPAPSFL